MGSNSDRRKDLVAYWALRIDECGMPVDWGDAHEACWACGVRTSQLELDRRTR